MAMEVDELVKELLQRSCQCKILWHCMPERAPSSDRLLSAPVGSQVEFSFASRDSLLADESPLGI